MHVYQVLFTDGRWLDVIAATSTDARIQAQLLVWRYVGVWLGVHWVALIE